MEFCSVHVRADRDGEYEDYGVVALPETIEDGTRSELLSTLIIRAPISGGR